MEENSVKGLLALLMGRVKLGEQDTKDFVEAMFGVIRDALVRDRLVKIKGLGTFKVVDIDPRESINVNTGERMLIEGHWKVSFTPDATMKELVNKPFSQFETVVLNEGVAFGDEDVQAKAEEPEETAPTIPEPTSESTEPAKAEVEPKASPVETYEAEGPSLELDEVPVTDETPEVSQSEENTGVVPSSHHAWKVAAIHLVGCLALMALSAWGGYLLGSNQQPTAKPAAKPAITTPTHVKPAAPKVAKADTVATADTLRRDTLAKPQQPKEETTTDYAKMDVRVRTGAYRIVGLNRTVKARAGEHVKNVSDRTLGPGMECYIEVFNGFKGNVALREGQEVRIPELKVKKRLKN